MRHFERKTPVDDLVDDVMSCKTMKSVAGKIEVTLDRNKAKDLVEDFVARYNAGKAAL